MTGGFKRTGKVAKRYQDIEKDLPPRVRKEPKPGDNPLKRPYPPHERDIRILDSLLRDVPREMPTEFSNRDLRTANRPQGLLYFHVLDIQDIKLSARDFVQGAPFCVYVEYECQGSIKCSYPVHSHRMQKIRIDHYAHFSAEVSEARSDEDNDFVIHIYAFQNPEKHWLIGSQLLHLYNFIREIHGISSTDVQDDLSYYTATITFEFAWTYGAYGYGHSNQLRNTKNPVYDSICHSMFPRISPSTDDLIDNKFRVRVPKRLRMITLYSLMVRVPVLDSDERQRAKQHKQETAAAVAQWKKRTSLQEQKMPDRTRRLPTDFNREAKTLVFRRVRYSKGRPVHVALNLDIHQKFMEGDFNQSYGEFICLRNRRERLRFLTRMVEGRLRDRYEDDRATWLFHPILDAKDCRTVLDTKKPMACPPGYLEHEMHPCQDDDHHAKVPHQEEDDKFVKGITSAPRFSGYLAQVFGYAKPPDLNKYPVIDHEFKVKPNAFLGGGDTPTDGMGTCQLIKYYIKTGWRYVVIGFKNVWEYIFPTLALRMELQLPEISVTLPSPADSTTEFYAHCVQEQIYPKVPDFTEAKRKAINLVKVSRTKKEDEDETDEEGEEEWNYEIEKEWNDIMRERERRRISTQNMNPVGKSVRKSKDVRALEHVQPTRFSQQRARPKFAQDNFLNLNM